MFAGDACMASIKLPSSDTGGSDPGSILDVYASTAAVNSALTSNP